MKLFAPLASQMFESVQPVVLVHSKTASGRSAMRIANTSDGLVPEMVRKSEVVEPPPVVMLKLAL